jgi:HAMP domain-containing protein
MDQKCDKTQVQQALAKMEHFILRDELDFFKREMNNKATKEETEALVGELKEQVEELERDFSGI